MISSRKIFTLWFALGVPLYLAGAVLIAGSTHILFGTILLAALIAWIYQSAQTTCARCAFYATKDCGLPGIVAPWITERKTDKLPNQAIRNHYRLDLFVLIATLTLYTLQPKLLPFAAAWAAGAWLIVYRPKRFHGLLHQIRPFDKLRASNDFTV